MMALRVVGRDKSGYIHQHRCFGRLSCIRTYIHDSLGVMTRTLTVARIYRAIDSLQEYFERRELAELSLGVLMCFCRHYGHRQENLERSTRTNSPTRGNHIK